MPQARAQTTKQAKASFKNTKGGPKLTERERRQLERSIVLQDRADQEKDRERRKQWAIQQKAKREEREKQLRQEQGVGLATQLAGYSHTQRKMKSVMEGFVKQVKPSATKEQANADVHIEDALNDTSVMDFDVDTEIFQSEGPGLDTSSKSIGDDEVIAVAPIELVQASLSKKRGPLQPSQSFGEGLDDDSLFEAESQATQSVAVTTFQASKPSKRSYAVMTGSISCKESITPKLNDSHKSATVTMSEASPVQELQTITHRTQTTLPDVDLAELFPSNTQVAHELTPPRIVSSRSLLKEAPTSCNHIDGTESDQSKNRSSIRSPSTASKYDLCAMMTTTEGTSSGLMMPPPRPRPPAEPVTANGFPRRSPKRDMEQTKSAFDNFGLSTQLVHAVIDDDIDLTDEDVPVASTKGKHSQHLSTEFDLDDDLFGVDADFG